MAASELPYHSPKPLRYSIATLRLSEKGTTRAVNPATGRPWETVALTTLSANRDIFPTLLMEARDPALQGKLLIYTGRASGEHSVPLE